MSVFKELADLAEAVELYCKLMDKIMKGPARPERGRVIAQAVTALEMRKDASKRFVLAMK